jgi:RNA polymerase sigma-70 factor (ECF subfamily)
MAVSEKSRNNGQDARHDFFKDIHERHSHEVWAMAFARWRDYNVADDITQETFLRLWKQWEEGEEILNPRAWLLRVARNLAEDHAKSAFRRIGTKPSEVMNDIAAGGMSPVELSIAVERAEQCDAALDALPAVSRRIVILYDLDGYTFKEIAELLAIPQSTIWDRLQQAHAWLRELLDSVADSDA